MNYTSLRRIALGGSLTFAAVLSGCVVVPAHGVYGRVGGGYTQGHHGHGHGRHVQGPPVVVVPQQPYVAPRPYVYPRGPYPHGR